MSLLTVRNLTKQYDGCAALRALCFSMAAGERLGVVGENGSGKSTLARLLTLLEPPDAGEILLRGAAVTALRANARRAVYRTVQLVFQNPQSTFDPRQKIGRALEEVAVNFGAPRRDAPARATAMLTRVALDASYASRYAHELSGGECQRVAIARALMANPQLLICDEITSALDVAVGAQILTLLHNLSEKSGMALLFISHDLALVSRLCGRVLVLQGGALVEDAPIAQLLSHPRSPCARSLVEAARLWTL